MDATAHGGRKVIPVSGRGPRANVYDCCRNGCHALRRRERTLKDLEQNYEGYVLASRRAGAAASSPVYANLWTRAPGAESTRRPV